MKKQYLKEAGWLIAIGLFSVLIREFLLPVIFGNSALYINAHDRYYLFGQANYFWIIMPGICFIVYLIRAIIKQFKNRWVACILALSSLFITLWLNTYGQTFFLMNHLFEPGRSFGSEISMGLFYGGPAESSHAGYFYIITTLQVILILFIGFIGVLTGRNMSRSYEQ